MRLDETGDRAPVVSSWLWRPETSSEISRRERQESTPVGGRAKRIFDIAFAVSVALILLPLIIIAALLVKASDGGSIIYRHRRVGYAGKEFYCLKFRTMSQNGDKILQEHLAKCPEAQKEWAESRKLTNDPRITAIGAILRKTSMDELPQLLNILRGEMSVVGPRPIVRDELAYYGVHTANYLRSRPGLTGAWQISGRSDTTYSERVRLDAEYVSKWSFMNDIWIVLCTVPAVAFAKGSR